jgi:2-methylisocitrate lyase-like PEP mutase family enzyme
MSRSTTLIRRWFGVANFNAHPLLLTDTAAVWDVMCQGACKHKGAEECAAATHLVFPYRGVYVHHVGMDGVPSADRLTELGVSRISYGPIPYIRAMGVLQQEAGKVLS